MLKRLAGLLLVGWGALASVMAGEDAVRQLLENARYWEANGRGDLARAALEKYLLVEPDNATVYYQLGMSSIRMGEAQRCPEIVARMRRQVPRHALTQALGEECRVATRLRVDMARLTLLKDAQDYDAALALMRRLFPQGPPPGRLGVEYLRLARLASGERAPELSAGLADAARFSQQHPEDLDYQLAYAGLLAMSPGTALQAQRLSKTLIGQENIDRAAVLAVWRSALERIAPERLTAYMLEDYLRHDPENSRIRALRDLRSRQFAREQAAIALRADAEPDLAVITRLEEAVKRFPADPWLRYDLVRLLLRRGWQNRAVGHLRDGLRNAPEDAEMRRMSAQIYAQLGMSEAALAQLQQLDEEALPQASRLRLLRLQARQQVEQGMSTEAARTYGRLLNMEGAEAADYRAYVELLQSLARTEDGASVLKLAVTRFPGDVWLRHQLARLYLSEGRPERAINLMIAGLDSTAGSPESLYALALIQDAAGRPLEALQSLAVIPERRQQPAHREMLERLRFARCLEVAESPAGLGYCARYAGDYADRQRQLALALHGVGETADAWQRYTRWVKTQPITPLRILEQAELALDMGLRDVAAPLIREIVALSGSGQALGAEELFRLRMLQLRELLERERSADEQRRLTRLVAEISAWPLPGLPTAAVLRALAQAQRELGQLQQAQASLAQLVCMPGAWDYDHLRYADLLIDLQEFAIADEVLSVRWEAEGATTDSRLELVRRWLRFDRGQALQRLAELQRAAERPDKVLFVRANVQEEAGQYARAEYSYQAVQEQTEDAALRESASLALQRLRNRRLTWVAVGGEQVIKPGTPGISELELTQLSVELQWTTASQRQAFVKIDPTRVSAGQIDPEDLDQYGQYATLSENARSDLPPQRFKRAEGVVFGLGISDGHWNADVGVTPVGFEREQWVGGLSYAARWSGHNYSLGLARRALSSTYLSYAGDRDGVSGKFWGAPLATGATLRLARYAAGYSYALGADWNVIRGWNVTDNRGLVARASADWRVLNRPAATLLVGLGLSYWSYAENQRYYTFGHGGYYSPQSYANLSLPVELRGLLNRRWSYQLQGRAGYSRSREDAADFYPGRPDLQALAVAQGGTPRYAGGSGSGNSLSWRFATEFQFAPEWVVGASFAQDRSAFYEPDFVQLYLRRSLARSRSPLWVPPAPVRAYQ